MHSTNPSNRLLNLQFEMHKLQCNRDKGGSQLAYLLADQVQVPDPIYLDIHIGRHPQYPVFDLELGTLDRQPSQPRTSHSYARPLIGRKDIDSKLIHEICDIYNTSQGVDSLVIPPTLPNIQTHSLEPNLLTLDQSRITQSTTPLIMYSRIEVLHVKV